MYYGIRLSLGCCLPNQYLHRCFLCFSLLVHWFLPGKEILKPCQFLGADFSNKTYHPHLTAGAINPTFWSCHCAVLWLISCTAHTGAEGSWYLLFAANLSCLTKEVYKTPCKENMAYGYTGLLFRVLPESGEGRRWKLLTLNHFCFYPTEVRGDLRISLFLQKKEKKRFFPSLLSAKQSSVWRRRSGSTPCICTVTRSAATFVTCESQSEKQVPASCRKSGLSIPLDQEALAWHITHCVVVHALGLQEIVEFIHQLELLVIWEGCKLLVETPVASLVFNGQLCACR